MDELSASFYSLLGPAWWHDKLHVLKLLWSLHNVELKDLLQCFYMDAAVNGLQIGCYRRKVDQSWMWSFLTVENTQCARLQSLMGKED